MLSFLQIRWFQFNTLAWDAAGNMDSFKKSKAFNLNNPVDFLLVLVSSGLYMTFIEHLCPIRVTDGLCSSA